MQYFSVVPSRTTNLETKGLLKDMGLVRLIQDVSPMSLKEIQDVMQLLARSQFTLPG